MIYYKIFPFNCEIYKYANFICEINNINDSIIDVYKSKNYSLVFKKNKNVFNRYIISDFLVNDLGYQIVSKKVYDLLSTKYNSDIEFLNCKVFSDEEVLDYYLIIPQFVLKYDMSKSNNIFLDDKLFDDHSLFALNNYNTICISEKLYTDLCDINCTGLQCFEIYTKLKLENNTNLNDVELIPPINFLYNVLTTENIIESVNKNITKLLKIIPEIKEMIGFEHMHPHHIYDVWTHTLVALENTENDFMIRLAVLFHDIGKPKSCTFDKVKCVRHFHGHNVLSKNITMNILSRLGFSEDFITKICFIVEHHDTEITLQDIQKDYELTLKLIKVQYADIMAHNPKLNMNRFFYLIKVINMFNGNEEYLTDINDKIVSIS